MSAGEQTFAKRNPALSEGALPYSREAEQAVLGSILLDDSIFLQAAVLLQAEDFFLPSNRVIFARMRELSESSVSIDQVTLTEKLILSKELEAIGGASYISSLTDGIPRSSNIEHYAKIIKDRSLLRRLIKAAQTIEMKSWDSTESPQTILDEAQQIMFSLAEYKVRSGFLHVKDVFNENFESLDARHDRGKRVTGLETGFRQFDDMTRGL